MTRSSHLTIRKLNVFSKMCKTADERIEISEHGPANSLTGQGPLASSSSTTLSVASLLGVSLQAGRSEGLSSESTLTSRTLHPSHEFHTTSRRKQRGFFKVECRSSTCGARSRPSTGILLPWQKPTQCQTQTSFRFP
jgi:hypothetical protein